MIVKNEEKYLVKCLESVKELVDEMIIVDTGSIDSTVDIAKKFGAKILHYTWDNNFSNARNFSLKYASKDWILLMDGDDEFAKEDYSKFIQLVNTSSKDAHYFKTLSYAGKIKNNNIITNLNLRLLKNNKKYKFRGAIHEQITPIEGKMDYNNCSSEDIKIYHYGYLTDVAKDKNKRKRNITIIEKALENDPHNPFHIFNLGNEYYAMDKKEKALELYNKVYAKVVTTSGYYSKLIIRRIMCLDELGRYSDALQGIEEGLKIYEKFVDLELIRGWIYMKLKRFTLAIDAFNSCLKIVSPPIELEFINGANTVRPLQALGDIYYQFEDYEKAYSYYEKMLTYAYNIELPMSKIASILNKQYENKQFVTYKLTSYINLEYLPNLLLISKLLINEGLYDLALGYLEKAKEMEPNNYSILFLLGKTLFYQKKYKEALNIMSSLTEYNDITIDALKYIFIIRLIQQSNNIRNILDKIKDVSTETVYSIYNQLYNIYIGKETLCIKSEDSKEILSYTLIIFEELLKVQEFELFETLLEILNMIESRYVLLYLAKLYYKTGFKKMAVKEVLRSIKELDAFDLFGAEILYREIG
ncbi:TPR domain-containing glycosyltransferase [Vallitalea sp. AN17-2]|uniref:TPR domain-containing glycosyltransferase n=2 Tax=Vallitalea maricola TaxID=3074433 RepID=A0ACB5UR11_9FIRM|nr:TPR domain-containing glycosyltransferase [Vallitalea sp. AN17-2]